MDQARMEAVENSAGKKPHIPSARQKGCLQPSHELREAMQWFCPMPSPKAGLLPASW